MKVPTLLFGLFVLFALLLIAGMGGAVGMWELALWLVLVLAWVGIWAFRGRTREDAD